jgi:hypothetical protein
MHQNKRIFINVVCILALSLIPACAAVGSTPTPSATIFSIPDIQENYSSFEGQLITVRGYGVIMMTVPLCPGYIGMDTRLSFIGESDNTIYAVVTTSSQGMDRSDSLREFQAYVRVFSGEIGCQNSLRTETFPFLEIIGIEE